jgi:anti-anti-sigma factor
MSPMTYTLGYSEGWKKAMQIAESRADGVLVLTLTGRLDSSTAPEFGRRLNAFVERGETKVAIDFAGLDYISSAGLAALLAATKALRAKRGDIVLAGVNDRIRQVFQMSGFVSLYRMFPNIAAATAG